MKTIKVALAAACAAVVGWAFTASAAYVPVEWIKASGSQWINTDCVPQSTDRVEIDVSLDSQEQQCLFCSRDGSSGKCFSAFYLNSSGWKLRFDYLSTSTAFSGELSTGRYVATMDGNARKWTVVSGAGAKTSGTWSSDDANPVSAFSLFCSYAGDLKPNATTLPAAMTNPAKYKLYSFRVYDKDGNLVRQYLPARDDSVSSGTAQYGVYETVNGTFHPGRGSGSFTAGSENVWRYNSVTGNVEYRVAVTYDATKGSVTADGAAVESGATLWYAVDKVVTLKATPAEGCRFERWDGLGDPAQNDEQTVRVSISGPLSLTPVFAPLNVYRVTAAGAGTKDGSSWENAAALSEIWPTLADGDELWLKAETYALTAALATDKQVTIRGGFAGSETSAAARTGTALTVFDGAKTYPNVVEGNSALLEFSATSGKITLDRLELKQSYTRGVQSTGGASVRLDDCVINDNGWRETTSKARSLPGRGAYLVGANGATAKFVRCLFKRNNNHSNGQNDYYNQDGCGAYVTTFGLLAMESTTFYQNGIALERTGKSPGREDTWGAALCVNATPVTATDCDFRANSNQNHGNGGSYGSGAGGMVFLNGNCGASTFTSCRFVGNFSRDFDPGSPTAGKFSGTLVLNLASTCSCLLDRCTVAYNFSRVGDAAAGVTVRGGAFTARNSIFWGNFATYRGSVGAANNVYVAAGSAVIDNCLVDGTGAGYFEPASNASLKPKFTGTTVTDDPLMVSSRADFLAMLAGTKPTDDAFQPTMDDTNARANMPSTGADPNTLDVHLKSKAGRYADGAWVTDDMQSPAIDGATEDAPYANETAPNGKRANLGGYGNTVEASRSLVGQPAIAGAALDQSNGTTMPDIAFTLGGEGEFKASVWVCHGRTKGSDDSTEGWEHVTLVTEAGTIGDSFKVSSKFVYEPGDTISWRVIVKASGGEANAGATEQISPTASKPKFWTAGGDPTKVIHVWAGAADYDCDGTGTSWRNAVGTLTAALALVSATKTEIWIAGDGALTAEPATVSRGLVVRGGFTAEESDPAERPDGTISLVDAGGVYKNGLRVSNPADTTTVFDRLDVRNALERGIYKTGAGSVEVTDCRLENNGCRSDKADLTVSGRGVYLSGAAGATALVRGCTFHHNRILMAGYSAQPSHGAGAYVSTFGSFTLEDSVFTENGESLGNTAGHGNTRGFALSVNNAPIAAHGCVFRANIGCAQGVGDGVSGGGGIVTLVGACDGSSFSHCLWSGNFHTSMSPAGTRGGALEIDMGDAAYTCSLSHCTIAYNLCVGSSVAAGLQIDKGTVTVDDSIIWGNSIDSTVNAGGADINVGDADSSVTVSTSLLGGKTAIYVGASGVSISDDGGMTYGDPLFVTSLDDYGKGYPSSSSQSFSTLDVCGAFDVHLRSVEGRWNGCEWVKDFLQSPAIDAAASAVGDEPSPNGGAANLGVYGQTVEASKTPRGGVPALEDFAFVESYDLTQPAATFRTGGEGMYQATVTACFDTVPHETAGSAGWRTVNVQTKVGKGEDVVASARTYYRKDETVYWRVIVSATDCEDIVREGSFTVTAETPVFLKSDGSSHGGDAERVLHVRIGAKGLGTGANWADGLPTLSEALELVGSGKEEIWVSGDSTTAAEAPVLRSCFALRGGFTGAEDAVQDRTAGAFSRIDAANAYREILVLNQAEGTMTIDGIGFFNAQERGLRKTGAASLELLNCRFEGNGTVNDAYEGQWTGEIRGRGAKLTGAPGATLLVCNCAFVGNRMNLQNFAWHDGAGCGAYVSSFDRFDLVDTLFASNGCLRADTQGHGNTRGFALRIDNTPTFAHGCDFRANDACQQGGEKDHPNATSGGIVTLAGACGGSVFDHCLWAGNSSRANENTRTCVTGGALEIDLADAADTCALTHCTIAYNLGDAMCAAAGLQIDRGAVTVEDSIVWGNSIDRNRNAAGADIYVADAASSVTLRSSLVAANSPVYVKAAGTAGVIVPDELGMTYGDPLFATSLDDYIAQIRWPWDQHLTPGYPHVDANAVFDGTSSNGSFDLHLRSETGRWNGTDHSTVDEVSSPAIDQAQSEVGDEPAPNGGVANLGRYGQTAEASMSTVGQPAFDELTVEERYDETMPAVRATLGGTGSYAATVRACFDTVAHATPGTEGWATVRQQKAVGRGETVLLPAQVYYRAGETVYWRVIVSAPGAEDVVREGSFTVTGETPAFLRPDGSSHGGDATKVVHVRLGAKGTVTGADWASGVASLEDAFDLVTSERNTVWVMGEEARTTAVTTKQVAFDVTVIGGFSGAEDELAQRTEGATATIDGTMTNGCLSVSVNSGKTLTLKGLTFRRSSKTALTKTGAGNLALVGCRFTDNGWYNFVNYKGKTGDSGKSQFNGGGANVSGGGLFAVTNCLVDGNVEHAPGGQYGNAYSFNGCGFWTSGVSVDIVNTSFLSNGIPAELFQAWCPAGREGMRGTALYVESAPSVKVEGCRFVGNRGCNHQGGAAIHIQNTGAAPRSIAFRNVLVAGNFSEVWYNGDSYAKTGAPLTILGSKQNAASPTTVELDRCTVAYNSTSAGTDCAGVMVIGADNATYAVSVRNSIFFGNLASFSPAEHPSAVDFRLGKNVSLDIDYSLIRSTELPYVMLDDASATATFGDHLVLGQDARFVTRESEFLASLQELNGRAIMTPTNGVRVVTKPDADPTAWNFHLRGGAYLNELTGETERSPRPSPALEAGDPAADSSREPAPRGRRINLGCYGGTEWATGPRPGLRLIVR